MRRGVGNLVRGLLAALAMVVMTACDEQVGMPPDPSETAVDTGRWTTVFPQEPSLSLTCLTAPQADELWVGYAGGKVRHWTDEGSRWHQLPSTSHVDDIHAGADGRCWVLIGSWIYHWDNHAWSEGLRVNADLSRDCLWIDDDGEVFVGGRGSSSRRPAVAHWNGSAWKTEILDAAGGYVADIWRTPGDGLVLARVEGNGHRSVHQLTADRWRPLTTNAPVEYAEGSLLVAAGDSLGAGVHSLHRVGRQGQIELVCGAVDLVDGEVLDFDVPLTVSGRCLIEIRDCQQTYTHELQPIDLSQLAVATRPWRPHTAIFGTDNDGNLYRLTRPDHGHLVATCIHAVPAVKIEGDLVIQDDRIYGLQDGQLVIGAISGDPAAWSLEAVEDTWLASLEAAPGGGLLAFGDVDGTRGLSMGWRSPSGQWSWTTPTNSNYGLHGWRDPVSGDFHVVNGEARYQVFRDGQWLMMDQLGSVCAAYAAIDATHQFAIISLRDGTRVLAAYDGETWREATPEAVVRPIDLRSLPHRQTLLMVAETERASGTGNDYVLWEFQGQQWQRRLEQWYGLEGFFDDERGQVYNLSSGYVRLLTNSGWKTVFERSGDPTYPGESLTDGWVDPERGLFVLDSTDRLHHRARRE